MTIDLFCLLISVMEIQLCKINAHFSWSFVPICMYIGVKMFNVTVLSPRGIEPHNVSTVFVQDIKL